MALTINATDVELERPVNTIFQQTLLRNAKSRCLHFLGSSAASVNENMGTTTATWRRITIGTNARAALTEQTTTAAYMGGRSASALAFAAPTATALKYGNFVILNEEVELYNYNGQSDKIVEILGIDGGDYLDSLQASFISDNGNTIFAAGAASEGAVVSKVTLNSVKNAVVTLDKNKALTFTPMTTGSQNFGTTQLMPGYIGICHPDVAPDIAALAGFKPAETYAGQVSLFMGEFGSITVAGRTVRFCSGHNADINADSGGLTGTTGLISTTGTNIDTYTTVIMGRDAWGSLGFGASLPDGSFTAGDEQSAIKLITQGLGSGGTSDPFREISTVAYKFWWAAVELNEDWSRIIVSGASSLSS